MKFFKLYSFMISLLITIQAHGTNYHAPQIHLDIQLTPHVAIAPALLLPSEENGRTIASVGPMVETKLVPGPDEKIESEVLYSPYELAGFERAAVEIISYRPGRTPASVDSDRWMEEWNR